MPSKKKKYNSRFPPARIKKIMQSDDEVGKVAAVVPIIISRALEIFVETLLKDSSKVTHSRNARTLTPAHLKASILSNSQFSFLKDIVSSIPDIQQSGEDEQGDGNLPLGSGPSASGVKFYRRATKSSSNANNISHSRGRGRPKKLPPSASQAEDEEENEEEEDANETADDEDEDNDEEGSSCDNSNCNASSSPKTQTVPVQHVSTFGLPRKPAPAEDDDYDA